MARLLLLLLLISCTGSISTIDASIEPVIDVYIEDVEIPGATIVDANIEAPCTDIEVLDCDISTYTELRCTDSEKRPTYDHCGRSCYLCANMPTGPLGTCTQVSDPSKVCIWKCMGCRAREG